MNTNITYYVFRREMSIFLVRMCSFIRSADQKIMHSITGLAALRKVLVGAKMVSTKSINYRKYKKPGTADTALADFYSVQPRNIKEYRRRFEYGTRQDLVRNNFSLKTINHYENTPIQIS